MEFSDLLFNEKHPIILSKNSCWKTLIVRKEHGKVIHGRIASAFEKVGSNY